MSVGTTGRATLGPWARATRCVYCRADHGGTTLFIRAYAMACPRSTSRCTRPLRCLARSAPVQESLFFIMTDMHEHHCWRAPRRFCRAWPGAPIAGPRRPLTWRCCSSSSRPAAAPVPFPDFDDNLVEAFQRETELFLASTLREDRTVLDLLQGTMSKRVALRILSTGETRPVASARAVASMTTLASVPISATSAMVRAGDVIWTPKRCTTSCWTLGIPPGHPSGVSLHAIAFGSIMGVPEREPNERGGASDEPAMSCCVVHGDRGRVAVR